MNSFIPKRLSKKTGGEQFTFTPKRSLKDFWAWAYSDLLQNTTRGVLAEYILAVLLGIDDTPRNPWDAYDLKLEDGTTIEVKTMSKLQGWVQKKLSEPRVILSPTRAWDPLTGEMKIEPTFNADIYIFCYYHFDSHEKANPLDMEQWLFFIMSQSQLISVLNGRKSVSLKDLHKNGWKFVNASELSTEVNLLAESLNK